MVAINVVLADPPGEPPHEERCFVEVETDDGRSVRVGRWRQREDGRWALRITAEDLAAAGRPRDPAAELLAEVETAKGRKD